MGKITANYCDKLAEYPSIDVRSLVDFDSAEIQQFSLKKPITVTRYSKIKQSYYEMAAVYYLEKS